VKTRAAALRRDERPAAPAACDQNEIHDHKPRSSSDWLVLVDLVLIAARVAGSSRARLVMLATFS
jgi:hypothetical protein